jgi:hypothetical protein
MFHGAQELGSLLGVSPEKAEAIAADMINDGRLGGHIDQVRGLVGTSGASGRSIE